MSHFVATGIGSLPGSDADEATRIIAGELPEAPHVVELPARGPGSDMVGRTMAMLADLAPDLAVETTPVGWRFSDAPGRVMRRAKSWLAEDLDAAQQHLAGTPLVKSQVCGPWTLAASVEMRNGERAVRDYGACRDISMALADAIDAHIRDIRRRLPSARVILQVDEPALPTVLAGGVSTASGIATYRAIDPQVAQAHLAVTTNSIHRLDAISWIHCCSTTRPTETGLPIEMMRRAGFTGLAIPLPTGADEEAAGRALDEGATLALGVLDPLSTVAPHVAGPRAARVIVDQLQRWGFPPESVGQRIIVTPDCGLAGTSPRTVREAYAALREAGRLIRDESTESA